MLQGTHRALKIQANDTSQSDKGLKQLKSGTEFRTSGGYYVVAMQYGRRSACSSPQQLLIFCLKLREKSSTRPPSVVWFTVTAAAVSTVAPQWVTGLLSSPQGSFFCPFFQSPLHLG